MAKTTRPQPPAVVSIAADSEGASAMLEAFIQAWPLATIVIDPNGLVRHWNTAAEKMFGWTAGDAVGRPNPIVPPQADAGYRGLRKRVLTGEILVREEIRGRRRDGSLVDLRISSAPLRDSSGDATGLVAFLEDITDKDPSEELRRPCRGADPDALTGPGRCAGTRSDSGIRFYHTVDLSS
jgi:PAS domain S-box-containing protein